MSYNVKDYDGYRKKKGVLQKFCHLKLFAQTWVFQSQLTLKQYLHFYFISVGWKTELFSIYSCLKNDWKINLQKNDSLKVPTWWVF